MLLKDYEQQGLLFNSNLTEPCTDGNLTAYRGEFVIQQGEVTDAAGRRSPPTKVLGQAVILANEHLSFVAGMLGDVADTAALLNLLSPNMQADTLITLFVFNIDKPITLTGQTGTVHLLPLHDGLAWTELMELAALEKSDIKNLTPADKALAVFRELISYKPRNAATIDLEQALKLGNGKTREVRGAV